MSDPKKPAGLTESHLMYLDHLRESGACNMYGASAYLMVRFPTLNKQEANDILGYWMKTFAERAQ